MQSVQTLFKDLLDKAFSNQLCLDHAQNIIAYSKRFFCLMVVETDNTDSQGTSFQIKQILWTPTSQIISHLLLKNNQKLITLFVNASLIAFKYSQICPLLCCSKVNFNTVLRLRRFCKLQVNIQTMEAEMLKGRMNKSIKCFNQVIFL